MPSFTFTNSVLTSLTDNVTTTSSIVSTVSGTVTDVSIALNGLYHTFTDDLDMLLVGPNGTNNLLFMSDAGSGNDFVNSNLLFSDGALATLSDSGLNSSGAYLPSNFNGDENDAQFGTATGGINFPNSGATFASSFGGSSSLGTWSLYSDDDVGGDSGSLNSWSVTISVSEATPTVTGSGGIDTYSTLWTTGIAGYFWHNGQMVRFADVNGLAFNAGSGADVINGGNGRDIVNDGADGDTVNLGGGNDTVIMGDASINGDTYNGGVGSDTFDASAFAWGVAVSINLSTATWSYSAGSESIIGFENINGANQFGTLKETLVGNLFANTINGNGGNDVINGLAGADVLRGGAGTDFIVGGTGADTMTGGTENDVFQYNALADAGDIITDYSNIAGNNDTFRISAASFGGGLVAGVLAASQFQIRADNLAQDANDRFIFRTTDRTLWFDSNGTAAGGLTMIADLQAGVVLTASDIVIF